MKGYKCDRCGEFESQRDMGEYSFYEISFVYNWVKGDQSSQSGMRYQLCNDCRADLVDWVEVDDT